MLSPDHSFVVPSISRDMRGLYDAHFAFVWRYMAHRGAPSSALDDLVQNVFRIVREHPSRHDPSRSRSVLVCMVARQALREFRKRHASLAQQNDTSIDLESDGPTTNFSRQASAQLLDSVLDGLTEMQREVVLLARGEKMPARDIADALGIPESTVQMRLESALKQMTTLVNRLRKHPLWECVPSNTRDAIGLLEAAQQARTPTDRDRERVFAAMLAVSMTGGPNANQDVAQLVTMAVQMPPPPPQLQRESTPPPPPMVSLAPSRNVILAMGSAAALAACVGMLGTWLFTSSPGQAVSMVEQPTIQSTSAGVAAEPSSPTPKVTTLPAVSDAPAVDQAPSEPSAPQVTPALAPAPVRKARPVKRPVREPKPANADEAKELFAVEHALRSGNAKLAQDLLDDHVQRFPSSKLSVEREALRAQILCERGRTRAARRIVLALEAQDAEPPLLAAVDQACTRE